MGFEHLDNDTISYAERLIHYKAQQLVGRAGLTDSDIDDIRQEMWLDLLERIPRFESDKATLETFIDRVVTHRMASILRHHCGMGRDYRRNGESLSSVISDADGQTAELAQTLCEDIHDRRTGSATRPALEQFELTTDIQTVLDSLPAPLRDLCQLLKSEPISVAACKLGITRHEASARLEKIREHFEEAGFEGVF